MSSKRGISHAPPKRSVPDEAPALAEISISGVGIDQKVVVEELGYHQRDPIERRERGQRVAGTGAGLSRS